MKRIVLWEGYKEGWIRTFGLSIKEIRERLKGVGFFLEEGPEGVDIYPEKEEDRSYILEKLGDYVYSAEGEPMEVVVGRALKYKGLTLGVAESCTGGLIASRIVNVPGSSAYFVGGFIVYSNDLKKEILGVKEETLKNFGAVSYQTCKEMLNGLKNVLRTDCGIAVTGIAGPGGTKDKPEGLTYIGVYVKDKEQIEEVIWKGERNENRFLSSQKALDMLRRLLS